MAFKIVFDTKEEVPADLVTNAKEDGGKFVIDTLPEGWQAAADVGGLTSALQKERDTAKTREKVLSAFGDITPTQAKDALKRLEAISKDDPEGKVKAAIAEREAQLIQTHETAIGEVIKDRDFWRNQSINSSIDSLTDAAIAEHKGNLTLLRPVVRKYIKAEVTDGKLVHSIVDDNGIARIGGTKDGAAVPMTASQLVKELKNRPDLAPAFGASGQSGGGTNGSVIPGTTASQLASMTPSARLQHLRQNGGSVKQ